MQIKFEVIDDDYRVIETHKWNLKDWDRVEKTISYLRKKYGKIRPIKLSFEPENNNSWVSE